MRKIKTIISIMLIIFCIALAGCTSCKRDNKDNNINDNTNDNVNDNTNDNVNDNTNDNVNDNINDNINDNVNDNINDNVDDNINDDVDNKVDDNDDDNINNQVHIHNYIDGACSCGDIIYEHDGTLIYQLSKDKTYYVVMGLKDLDVSNVVISNEFNGVAVKEIFKEAFANSNSLTSIIIPNSITNIGDNAFENCNNLIYNLYNNGKYLGNDDNPYLVFVESVHDSITSCIINENTRIIMNNAFSLCKNLTNITIPNGVEKVGDYAFSDCDNLKYNLYKNGKYLGNEENPYLVFVKFQHDTSSSFEINDNAKFIMDNAFTKYLSLTKIEIPDGVKSIGSYAFSSCRDLKIVRIAGSVKSIGSYAFYNSGNLISVEISNGVESIGEHAFRFCSDLIRIEIPSSMINIGEDAFQRCSSLKNIDVDDNNLYYKSINGNLYSKDGKQLIKYALGKTNTSFTIPDGVTSIGVSAFYLCSNLTSIKIPDTVTYIDDYAFCSCTGLTNIEIPNGVTSIGNKSFYYCTSLTSIEIPSSVISIGDNVLDNCTNLENLILSEGLINIGNNAFNYCKKISNIELPNSLTNIGNQAFYRCDRLSSVNVGDKNLYYKSIDGNLYTKDGKVLLLYAQGKTNVYFEIPNGVISIGDYALDNCDKLTNIIIPNSVITIGVAAFSNCVNLKGLTIPNSVTTIGDEAFISCTALNQISIPDSVVSIGYDVFLYCTSLKKTVYDNAKYLGNEENPYLVLFASTTETITSCEINENTKIILYNAFQSCNNLTSMEIPSSVEHIGLYAFTACTHLKNINVDENNLHYKSIDGNLYTKDGKELIQYAIGKGTTFEIPNGVEIIKSNAFRGCSSLTKVIIPNTVTCIEDYAFTWCKNLKSIVIPSSVINMGCEVFKHSSSVEISCEQPSKLSTWHDDWNIEERPVVWYVKKN